MQKTDWKMASEFVDWKSYEERWHRDISYLARGDSKIWVPDRAYCDGPSENFEWSSDEEEYINNFYGERIVSRQATVHLCEIETMAKANRLRRQRALRLFATIDPQLLNEQLRQEWHRKELPQDLRVLLDIPQGEMEEEQIEEGKAEQGHIEASSESLIEPIFAPIDAVKATFHNSIESQQSQRETPSTETRQMTAEAAQKTQEIQPTQTRRRKREGYEAVNSVEPSRKSTRVRVPTMPFDTVL